MVLASALMVCVLSPSQLVLGTTIGQVLMDGNTDKPRAPSYFSQYFLCQIHQAEDKGDTSNTVRTLYIDRDPVTFKDISLHLQGYHVMPRDGSHFVRLFADAQFYSRKYRNLYSLITEKKPTNNN